MMKKRKRIQFVTNVQTKPINLDESNLVNTDTDLQIDEYDEI